MSQLALLGGIKVRQKPFPGYYPIGEEEKRAVMDVMDSKMLSGFLGAWSEDFYGGPRVQKLEKEWAAHFKVAHAVTVNSATSALDVAVGALGVGPGDEVIVSPYTMTASVSCVLLYNAIPVFADIDPVTFCLDPKSVASRITPRTKAIIVVDLFGHPFEADQIMALAKQHGLKVIEDAAQAYGAMYHGRPAGTLADIGVFSLNVHKTIHCGEGGVCVTNDAEYAERMQLLRNHGEVVVKKKGTANIVSMIGRNYRMCEIEAAIASEQLKKVDGLARARMENAAYLTKTLQQFPGITTPQPMSGICHGYYSYPLRYHAEITGVSRTLFATALRAEGIPVMEGYVEPVYLQPLYQQRIAYGSAGCPFSCPFYESGHVSYAKGICPVTERLYEHEFIAGIPVHQGVARQDLDDILCAYEKVLGSIDELARHGATA